MTNINPETLASGEQWQIHLVAKPKGKLLAANFEAKKAPVPQAGASEVLVRTLILSVDAANRAWMQGATYRQGVEEGDVMHAYGLGRVAQSNSPKWRVGQLVLGELGWREYAAMQADQLLPAVDQENLSYNLSVFGIAGLTAWHGIVDIGRASAGKKVLISAAAGSVGSLAAQIAKNMGCEVAGIAGGPQKCGWLKEELGIDAIDYKAEDLNKAIAQKFPKGIDIYFDNVGGPVLQTALFHMAQNSSIVCCGAVSQYDIEAPGSLIGIPGLLVVNRVRMEGFIFSDFAASHGPAIEQLRTWLNAGSLVVKEDVKAGLKSAPDALIGLLGGDNIGKRLVKVADPV